ncbi:hypothetical protein JHK85_044475 [Glycine max]|nr:hypothetical protein JHK85_044475 [Glycine max]
MVATTSSATFSGSNNFHHQNMSSKSYPAKPCLATEAHIKLFNVAEYGAITDGKEDNSVSDACNWNGSATVLIPEGTYMLKSVIFKGPCNGSVTFQIKGTLDGQGSATRQKCKNNANCEILFTTMDFDFITNGHVQNLHSIDSKGGHFIVFGCENMTFTDLTLKSPENNHNTDGIKISQTNGINITDKPCQNITMDNINLWGYSDNGKGRLLLRNYCFEVNGASYGKQSPPSCTPHRATPLSA